MESIVDREQALDWVLDKLAARSPKPPPVPKLPALPKLTVEQKKQELQTTQSKELQIWHDWKKQGEPPHLLDQLLTSYQRLLQSRVNLYKNRVELPTSTIEMEHKKWLVHGLRTYEPGKAKLNTWLTKNLQKAGRWIDSNKNTAYISENISRNIGAFNAFRSDLRERLGHEPDAHTILDEAVKSGHPKLSALSLKDIKRLGKEQRKGLVQTTFDSDILAHEEFDPREMEVALLILPQLTPQERVVHEYTVGLNGKPRLKPGAIAKAVGMDNSKVAKLRSSAWKKMQPYLGGA